MPSTSSSRALHLSSDNDSVDIHDDADSDLQSSRPKQKKPSGACVDCKSVKVRCEFVPGERKCRRCQLKNLPCRPRERKKRKPADTHEQLQERSHEQDLHIQNLLLQYDQRIAEQKFHQWVLNMPESGDMGGQQTYKWMYKGKSPEAAVLSHFSGSGTPLLVAPEIVKHCSLYPEDVQELFSIYFSRVNPYFSLLDQNYHTPERLIRTCPFLFTVICAVASRYYSARPKLYTLAMEFARDCAGKGLIEGHRSIDVCQAYLIMAVYPVPKKRWAEDKSWLLMGVAIRMAIELELNQPPPPTCDTREALNRMRTWLNCFCVDGSHAIQFGKLPMLRLDDYLARNSRDWYKSSPLNTAFDVHLCAYVQMILHMAKWREYIKPDEPRAEDDDVDTIVAAAINTQGILAREMDIWKDIYNEEYLYLPLPICNYRSNTSQLIAAYLRLCVLTVGFQKMKAEDLRPDSEILVKCIDAARSVLQIAIERLYPTGYMRYAMEANFLYVAFAAAFLINLLRPRYLSLLSDELQRDIIQSVSRLISILRSDGVALDGRHTPALYSRFLASLMDNHGIIYNTPSSPTTSHSRDSSYYGITRDVSPQDGFMWPDVQSGNVSSNDHGHAFSQDQHGGYHMTEGQIDMDFSLSHFIRTVSSQQPSPPPSIISAFADQDMPPMDDWQIQWKNTEQQQQQQMPGLSQWNLPPMFQQGSSAGIWTGV
ncbi:hypothetical protein D9613_003000 [Agrocybe pediades]|uniref:Zn(2)-C6 fungal-type domain-containing protein n=1 Tax=Agrocybe pediades TaxID=84607 RepID=A0A8H4QP97_9AGAR|nr:hypothetical protein D9613_003000 [Agrocybe pediades]